MAVQGYTSEQLFDWLLAKHDFLLLDVRNEIDFGRFKVEGPFPIDMANVAYMDFMEWEDESVKKVPQGKPIRIVCAKEGSAKYVGEILVNHGFTDVAYLMGGIKTWGNMLNPAPVVENDRYGLYQFRRPGKASCSYGLTSGDEMMLFDPAKNVAAYQSFAGEKKVRITRTFETHRQADYISGSPTLNRAAGAQIMAPDGDFQGARFAYTPVSDGDVYTFKNGGPQVKVIHTPGHTPGSTCYLIDDTYLISGDTVFIYSMGRPDLGGKVEEWSHLLFNTMTRKILSWPDDLTILPGHYMDWAEADKNFIFQAPLGKIKEINKEIYGITDLARFTAYIKSNMRKQPDEYATIREINAGLKDADDEQRDILDLGKNECAASAKPH